MLLTRILTAAVLLPLVIGALLYLPNRYWAVLLLAPLVVGSWEWWRRVRFGGAVRWAFAGIVLASCLALLAAVSEPTGPEKWFEFCAYWIAAAFWVALAPWWLVRRWRVRSPLALGVVGWIVLVPTWLAMVRMQQAAGELLMLMGVIWVADTAAYVVGRRFGRHKLAPQVSPGKTWEGVFGAAVAVALYHLSLRFILGPETVVFLQPAGLVLFLMLALAGILGDLFESWIKREAGVKDSGRLLPGHGGVLDRIDALTAAMPLAALALLYMN